MESRITQAINESPNPSAQTLMEDFKSILQRVEHKAVDRAKAADYVVRGHPYPALGVAMGVGLLLGLVVGRKWHS